LEREILSANKTKQQTKSVRLGHHRKTASKKASREICTEKGERKHKQTYVTYKILKKEIRKKKVTVRSNKNESQTKNESHAEKYYDIFIIYIGNFVRNKRQRDINKQKREK